MIVFSNAARAGLALWLGAGTLMVSAQTLLQPGPRSDLGDGDTVSWRVGAHWERDDNVLRQPETQASADHIRVTSAGLRINKPWSLQRLELDLSLQQYEYQRFDALDFTAFNYIGAFGWAFTPQLRGSLRAERREFTDLFSDVGAGRINRRTELNHGLDAEYVLGASWRGLAGVFDQRSRNSAQDGQTDASVRGGELGARYEWRPGTSLAWRWRQGHGDYPGGSSAGDFVDRQQELELQWQPTGQLQVSGRLGWLRRDHDVQPVRDFSGWAGRMDARWQLTGKTRLSAGLLRELASYQSLDASYYEGWRAFVEPEWKPSAKTAVRLRLDQGRRHYKGAPIPPLQPARQDRLQLAALALEWEPIRPLRVMATVQRDERKANREGLDYRAHIYGLAAQLWF